MLFSILKQHIIVLLMIHIIIKILIFWFHITFSKILLILILILIIKIIIVIVHIFIHIIHGFWTLKVIILDLLILFKICISARGSLFYYRKIQN